MNTEKLAEIIRNPNLAGRDEADGLKELVSKYPYVSSFPLLLLKGLSNQKSLDFDSALEKYAFLIADRTQLHALVHSNELVVEMPDAPLEAVVESQDSTEERVQEMQEEVFVDAIVELEEERAIEETEESERNEELVQDSSPVIEQEEVVTEANSAAISLSENDELEEIYLSHVMNTAYSLDHLPDLKGEEAGEEKSEETIEVPPVEVKGFEDLSLDLGETEEQTAEESGEERSFLGWLHAAKREDSNKEDATAELSKEDLLAFEPVQKEKREFFSPTKKAKESIDAKRIPVSETLAKIFAVQGNYPKAIDAYEQLMLLFPEKKVFFASQIEILKEKINL